MPPIREEGDTTVMPVVEEVVVVERRLVLKEEIRIRRVRTTEHHRENVVVRTQDAVITRVEAGPQATGDARRSLETGHTPTNHTPLAQEQAP
jgi:stress response protein YsnF